MDPIDPALRLRPGQQELTPAQEVEAKRCAEMYIQQQLSTELVDEPEAERLLHLAYEVAGLAAPQHILWLDGPRQLAWMVASKKDVRASVEDNWRKEADARVMEAIWKRAWDNPSAEMVRASVRERVERLREDVRERVERVEVSISASLVATINASKKVQVRGNASNSLAQGVMMINSLGVSAYGNAPWLFPYHFYDRYLAPNGAHALAHFNQLVSGYWLGREEALIVRRPGVLSRDGRGHLHSATGKCVEYYDGWGFYAWHGVRVPEKIILTPEALTRDDFLSELDLEVRRLIQERMGERFVPEMGGRVIDRSPRGTLYEVKLPREWERVAHYVQVQDASTARQYVLRVPPTIQTAAEAVAWGFGLSEVDYRPEQET